VPVGKPLVITPGNFTEDGKLSFTEKNSKRFRGEVPQAFRFDVGDLVVVITDLPSKMKILGKPAFIESENVLHNQRIGRVLFLNDDIEKRLLYYYLMTDSFLKNIKSSATGTMVKHTAPKRILNNAFRFPKNRKQQQSVVESLDKIRFETSGIQSVGWRKHSGLDELKRSILQKAFSGEILN